MMIYSFSKVSPVPVLFGDGASEQTGVKLKELGVTKVVLVTDQGVKSIAEKIVDNIKKEGIKVVLYDKVLSDPPDYIIEECAALAKEENVDGVVGVGGGSSLDAAKLVNALLGNPSPITRYFDKSIALKPGKVLVLLPTTSGTGSEVTGHGVVTESKTQFKGGVGGPPCNATLAIVDPLLTVGMPPAVTAGTGMDALAHAAEAVTSRFANPVSETVAEKVIALVKRYLPRAVKNGNDLEARNKMSLAAMMGGIAFSDALPHLPHAVSHALIAVAPVPHGVGCALALPEVIEIQAEYMPEQMKVIGAALGLQLDDVSGSQIGKKVADAIRELNKEVGITKTLKDFGVKQSDLEEIVPRVLKDDCAFHVPEEIPVNEEMVLKILNNLY
mgnify:CR=1 FL=1